MGKLAIIILSSDTIEILENLYTSIVQHVKCDFNIYLGYNSLKSRDIVEKLSIDNFGDRIKIVYYDYYNFAKINNDIVNNHLLDEDKILFCNNDIVLRDNIVDNISVILDKNDKIGTVGCRLVYDNETIQHDGQYVLVDTNNRFLGVSHLNLHQPNIDNISTYREVAGNTFALCGTTRKNFDLIGGLNEKYIKCFEDVEFNLALQQKGLMNVICPSKYWAWHKESFSRKLENASYVEHSDIIKIANFINNNFNNLNNKIFYKKRQ